MPSILDMDWHQFRDKLRLNARDLGIPAFGTFELTPLCNFNCKICYIHLSLERMLELGHLRTADEWVDMARQAGDMGTIAITLTGGEVLTRPDFEEIYARISNLGLIMSVLSNGALVDEDIVKLFRKIPPSYLRFTLYGASNLTYERVCGCRDGFDRVMRSLSLLHDAGIRFSLAFTETRDNIEDFDQIIEIAQTFDAKIAFGTRLVSAVRGAKNEVAQLRVAHAKVPTFEPKVKQESSRSRAQKHDEYSLAKHPFARCKAYRNSFWIDWTGDMEMCAFMSSSGIKAFDLGFKSAWDSLLKRIDRIKLPEPCLDCAFVSACSACPGVLEAETGSAEKVCDWICRKARLGRID